MLAQAVVLAAEVRQTVSSKGQDYHVALAAHDIKAVGE